MAKKIGEVYGFYENKKQKSISSSGMMFIDFKKQASFGNATLEAKIKYNKLMPDCQNWLDMEKNTLKSPEKYGINFNCSWLLSSNFGSYIILHFNHVYVSFLLDEILSYTDMSSNAR